MDELVAIVKRLNQSSKAPRFSIFVWKHAHARSTLDPMKNILCLTWRGMSTSAKSMYTSLTTYTRPTAAQKSELARSIRSMIQTTGMTTNSAAAAAPPTPTMRQWMTWASQLTVKNWNAMGIAFPPIFYVFDDELTTYTVMILPCDVGMQVDEYKRAWMEVYRLKHQPLRATLLTYREEQGPRPSMEDSWFEYESTDWIMYGVCDGHGGAQVSKKLSHAKDGIAAYLDDKLTPLVSDAKDKDMVSICDAVSKGIRDGCVSYDQTVLEPLKYAQTCGSTCIMVLISKRVRVLWVAHVGDARAVVIDHVDGSTFETMDHKPGNVTEKKRIQDAGAEVVDRSGVDRVQVPGYAWELSLSRAFGDWGAKQYRGKPDAVRGAVCCVADVTCMQMTNRVCDIVLACDGLWDGMNRADLIQHLCAHSSALVNTYQLASSVAGGWIKQAYRKSTDNITLLWIRVG